MNLSKALTYREFLSRLNGRNEFLEECYQRAVRFISKFSWQKGISEAYVGMLHDGILCVFLFDIELAIKKEFDDDNFVWVIVGDVPPAYITCEDSPNPACALDGYVGAMREWVDAVNGGKSVENLIPVNAPATKEYASMLQSRLDFIDERILSSAECKLDLKK